MKQLIEATREAETPWSIYLQYSRAPAFKTASLDGAEHFVNVDFDERGEQDAATPGPRSTPHRCNARTRSRICPHKALRARWRTPFWRLIST